MSDSSKEKEKSKKKMNQTEPALRPTDITEQNLKHLEHTKLTKPINNSKFIETNISLVSTNSSYQDNLFQDDDDEDEDNDDADLNQRHNLLMDDNSSIDQHSSNNYLSDPFLRPLSQNSSTSCLSTTATKDGIEGRRLYRNSTLNQYTTNLINNNPQYYHQPSTRSHLNQHQTLQSQQNNDDASETAFGDIRSNDSNNASIISLHQTSIYPESSNNSNSIQIDD
ncbi:uncharacterized protein KGF55_000455 [Candida pseudojiufengensis]|uniref:uncharacterized protein n=1 Tax=Candida pseudojiufengensis TaxID=497109 RepID=UPI0022255172|nr:uncharacterized protein KGF55_000455 [Candida pseudojiufengensis]KAI5966146.1 hypothetical protein KGF55_000455 [Candida pseudojiufengensis]